MLRLPIILAVHNYNLCLFYYFSTYLVMVSIFFVVQVVNNYALNFNISMPLHMIFRAVSILLSVYLSEACVCAMCRICLVVSFPNDQQRAAVGPSQMSGEARKFLYQFRISHGRPAIIFSLVDQLLLK